jgi:serine protease Do
MVRPFVEEALMAKKSSVGLALSFLIAAAAARGEQPPAAGAGEGRDVQPAIARVYPALVQILVVERSHEGGRERKFEAAGSGAIVSPEGYIVTNHHVAGKATSIKVILSTHEELPAVRIGTDVLADICVIKLDLTARAPGSPPLPVAGFGSSSGLKVGDVVLAMGCPRALSQSVTKGIVANKEMMMPRFGGGAFMLDGEDVGSLVKWIGHDAMIQPGNSGGPLVNLEGEIVGVNEIGIGTMSGAIPSDIARVVADDLIAHGKVRRAWIGAEFQPMLKEMPAPAPSDAVATLATDMAAKTPGVLVSGVIPGSPAERAGLRAGDVVEKVDGTPVQVRFREELPAFTALLLSKEAGKPIVLKIRHPAEGLIEGDMVLTPELRDDAEGKEIEATQWGLTVREITTMVAKELQRPDKRGVIAGSVRRGWPADQAQPAIRAGDVIVAIGGKPVEGLDSFEAITAEITAGKSAPVPTLVDYERHAERFLTLVEIGIKPPQAPTPEARKAWFPAATQVLSRKLAAALGIKGKKGVRIVQIYPESAAEEAGFAVGDILTQIDGQPIEASEPQDADVFDTMIRGYKIGATPEFTVIRGAAADVRKIACRLDEAPKPERELKVYEDHALDFKARDISYFDRVEHRWAKDVAGALVVDVETGGWAAVGGLRPDDVVQALDGAPVASASDLEALLRAAHERRPRHISMLVKRGIHTLFIEIEPSRAEKN